MPNSFFMDRIRSFFGLQHEPPRNDFRNPIWGSDDDDDGDELYTRQRVDINQEAIALQREFAKTIHDMFTNIGVILGDINFFDNGIVNDYKDNEFPTSDYHSETFDSNRIRNQYLKPGYDDSKAMQDEDLDDKLSSQDISKLLNQEENRQTVQRFPLYGSIIPEGSFYTTIITKVTRPDGTVETRKTVKAGEEIIEDKTTTTKPNSIFNLPFGDPFNIDYSYNAL